MRKLLVHLHLYYLDQADYFVSKLRNICGCEWDLIVTMVRRDAEAEAAENKIRQAFPRAEFMTVENRGYDIWPFIQVIKQTNLDEYDFILKLHTKNFYPKAIGVNKLMYGGYEWRDTIVNCYMGDDARFQDMLDLFDKDEELGMLCCRLFYMPLTDFLPEDTSLLRAEMRRIGIESRKRWFMGGSMFMARTAPYKLLQSEKISAETFPEECGTHSYGSMAHIYERIISLVVSAAGYRVGTVSFKPLQEAYLAIFKNGIQRWIENCFAVKRLGEDMIKYLVLFGIKIPLEKTASANILEKS